MPELSDKSMQLPKISPSWTPSLFSNVKSTLESFFPPAFFHPGIPPSHWQDVIVERLPPSAANLSEISDVAKAGRSVNVALAQHLFLKKFLRLSRGASKEATAAIATELQQAMPARGEGLIWREMLVRADRKGTDYVVFLLKRAELDHLLRTIGSAVRTVTIAGAPGVAPLVDARAGHDRPMRFWRIATPAIAATILAAAMIGQWQQNSALREGNARLNEQIAALQERAVTARELAETQNGSLAALVSDVELFEQERQRLAILAGLAETLGADARLSSLIIDRNIVRLTGQTTREIPELIESISATGWLKSPRLDGPIVVDPASGERRFQLIFNLGQADQAP